MIIRSFFSSPDHRASLIKARALLVALLVSTVALALAACTHNLYQFPEYTFAGRPVPPSSLAERVMVAVTANGSTGYLEIMDALRDIRNNIENTKPQFIIGGYSGSSPSLIYNFPEQQRGYVYNDVSPYSLSAINYSTESSLGAATTLTGPSYGFGVSSDFLRIYAAQEATGQLLVTDNSTGAQYALNLPNVFNVVSNQADTVTLAMVRNSNLMYRVVKLPVGSTAVPGAADCEPEILPLYCAVPVTGNFDRPVNVVYSLDGSTAYVLNCGVECGGGGNGGAGVSFIPQGLLNINIVPTSSTYPNVVTNTVSIPGGATAALSDATTLYISGQSLQPDGLFAGNLTLLNLSNFSASAPISISDGYHSRMLFADNNTLWIGSQNCATGERARQAAAGVLTQAANYNCLTRYVLGTNTILPSWASNTAYAVGQQVTDGANTQVVVTAGTSSATVPAWKTTIDGTTTDGNVVWANIGSTTRAQIIPAITPNSGVIPIPYPNANYNLTYYGSLTGICWVQNFFKVYTAYGGQVHLFNTADGSERNNSQVTVQGTALDVAYLDALTNTAN